MRSPIGQSRFAKFLRLPTAERWWAIEAFAWLGVARLAVLTIPFRRLAASLGIRQTSEDRQTDSKAPLLPELLRVARIIRQVSNHTPWRSNCLAQALAGRGMLSRRGVASTLYFGVAKNEQGELEAHAWLRSGETTVTGATEIIRYAVVARFADSPRT